MGLGGILFFVARAVRFSLAVCAVYAVCRLIFLAVKRHTPDWRRETVNLLFVAYFAALVEIIALRGGMGETRELRLVPLHTTLGTLKDGPWAFVYNLMGNLIWFMPLGMFLHKKKPLRAMLIGAAVSLSLEALQWLMMTGVTDIDDVIINALGTFIGAIFMRILNKNNM